MVACNDNTGWPAPIWFRGNVLEECVPANILPGQEGEVGGGGRGKCRSQAQYLRGGVYLCRGVRTFARYHAYMDNNLSEARDCLGVLLAG